MAKKKVKKKAVKKKVVKKKACREFWVGKAYKDEERSFGIRASSRKMRKNSLGIMHSSIVLCTKDFIRMTGIKLKVGEQTKIKVTEV